MKKVLILGADGYIGWSLLNHLAQKNYEVFGIDNGSRRRFVDEVGSNSITPILSLEQRIDLVEDKYNGCKIFNFDIAKNYDILKSIVAQFNPDAIVHLAEMPSAPYSMIDIGHAEFTYNNNLIGTLNLLHVIKEVNPDIHLVKLGTMGEYGTPEIDISEGDIEIEYKGKKTNIPFPRQPGSFYHQSKLHDTNTIMFTCKNWGLKCTDIMQGVVYGTQIDAIKGDPLLRTRYDIDGCFGTAINRFCAQAIAEIPITPYGKGEQKRGFLALRDSIQCLEIIINSEIEPGEYNVINQFEEVYGINELARIIKDEALLLGLEQTEIQAIDNPRKEQEEHYYNPEHKKLLSMGYKPTSNIIIEIKNMLIDLMQFKQRILTYKQAITPIVKWK